MCIIEAYTMLYLPTVSVLMLPRGSIFQYEFLGGVNTKNPSKSGGLFKKTPKNWTFHITWGSIQEWGYNIADTVVSN